MCAHYLIRKGSAWTFQIRMPVDLAPDSTLSRIRIPIGAMSAILARRQALLLAAVAQVAFARVRALDKANTKTCDTGKLSEQMILAMVPMLMGMDALADAIEHDLDPAMIDHTFDVLAQIGHDQARGQGVFSNPAVRPEAPYIAALKSPPIAKAMAGTASLDGLSDTSTMLSTIQSLSSRIEADIRKAEVGQLFSVTATGRIEEIKTNKGPKHELVGIYERVLEEFVALCGDRPVGAYGRKDLQHYVDEISWLPKETSSQKHFEYKDVKKHIDANRAEGGRGLAAKTITQGRLAYVKAIIALGCTDANIRNPVEKSRINIPDRAARPAMRIAPGGESFEAVWRAGIATGILSDALLPALGYLTGRRVGLLAMLYREDLVQIHGVWAFQVRSHHIHNGIWEKVPIKSDASSEIIIVPQVMVDSGFVEWVRQSKGPLFPALMVCKDPGDAAQKRLNRLIKDFTAEGDLGWVFHALRHGKIDNDRDNKVDTRLIMKTVGHEIGDIHNAYGRLTPKQMKAIATATPPENVDWTLLATIDFETFSKAKPHRRRPKR